MWKKCLLLPMLLFLFCQAYADEALELAEKGHAYFDSDRFVEAFDCYMAAMQKAEESGNEALYEQCMGNIGNIFAAFENYGRAIFYYKKVYDNAVRSGNNDIAANSIINIVQGYCLMGNVDKAKEYFRLQNEMPLSDLNMRRYFFYQSQAAIAYAEKKYNLAISLYRKIYELALEQQMEPFFTDFLYNEIGNCHIAMGELDSAIMVYEKNIEICSRHNMKNYLAETYKNMEKAFSLKGDKPSQLRYQEKYDSISGSIFNEKQFNMAQSKLFSYEENKANVTIETLSDKFSQAVYIIVVIVFILLVVATLAFIIYRQNRNLRAAYIMLYNKNNELIAIHDKSIEMHTALTNDEIRTQYNEFNMQKLFAGVVGIMENQEYIFNPEFNITMLANAVGSNVKYVSAVINEKYQKTFKTLLNECRVREACKRLSDEDGYGNLTIKAIAESVGYNSINNFIIAFKKITGMTPSAYQKVARMKDKE